MARIKTGVKGLDEILNGGIPEQNVVLLSDSGPGISTLAWEHRTAVRRFGSELNTVALMYLMTTIIFPALTVTFLIVLGSFSGITVPQALFVVIIIAVLAFQFFFINFIKTRRPVFEE